MATSKCKGCWEAELLECSASTMNGVGGALPVEKEVGEE